MIKTFKYRLYPTKEQAEKLQWALDRCRELYNAALQERKEAYESIIADFVSILYSFCAKLYGQRRAKRKTEKLVQELTEEAQAEKNTAKEGGKADATR